MLRISSSLPLLVSLCALGLSACGDPTLCINQKQAAQKLAEFSADVQSASLKKKISMDELREITGSIDAVGSHYSASNDHNQFCKDIERIRKDHPAL